MYYHPLILTEAQKQRRLAMYQDTARLWFDGIDRQLQLHMDVVSALCVRVRQNLEVLSEATDMAHFYVRWSACAFPASLSLLQLSGEPGAIAADVQRQAAMLADRHTNGPFRNTPKHGTDGGTSARLKGTSSRRQMMA